MSTEPFNEEQWWKMCDLEIGRPQPLHTAKIDDFDWVYYRPWGVMAVGFGQHVSARALLYSFHHGYNSWFDLARARGSLGRRALDDFAEAFLLEIPGTAFLSSVADFIWAGKRENIDSRERTVFRRHGFDVCYLEDKR